MAITVVLSCGLAEGALFALAGFSGNAVPGNLFRFEDVYVSNRPIAVYDLISGYRRTPGPTRIARIVHDTVVFDHTFTPNNAGYISNRDYTHAKAPGTTRLAVLGDSFTAAEFIRKPWPDAVHDALRGRTPQPVELYSFAVNGAGLGNWHSIFVDDIVPNYPFDALVIATFGDDFARGYSYLHYDGTQSYIGYFPTRAASDEDFLANYKPRMAHHFATVASGDEIDGMVRALRPEWHRPEFALRLPALIAAQTEHFRRGQIEDAAVVLPPPTSAEHLDLAAVEARYGAQFALFRDIMTYCREHGIPVILAAIPGRSEARTVVESRGRLETDHQREVRFLAESFGATYMDGYAPFAVVAPGDIDRRYWLQYDAHWNQAGSDLFAAAMTDFLLKQPDLLRPRARTPPSAP